MGDLDLHPGRQSPRHSQRIGRRQEPLVGGIQSLEPRLRGLTHILEIRCLAQLSMLDRQPANGDPLNQNPFQRRRRAALQILLEFLDLTLNAFCQEQITTGNLIDPTLLRELGQVTYVAPIRRVVEQLPQLGKDRRVASAGATQNLL
jgi:hypothetical protein